MDSIVQLFTPIAQFFQSIGIPFGEIMWMFILTVSPLLLVIIVLLVRGRRGGGLKVDEGLKKIIASTGDVSGGMAGVKKVKFIKSPAEAMVFLKVEENAIQQALAAVDYYVQQGEIDEGLKTKFVQVYQDRLDSVRAAIAKDEEFKEIVDTSSAVDRARSDYLQKLAAMSGTAVETDEGEAGGPASVGMPSSTATTPTTETPSGGPPGGAAPSGGPPGGGPPGGAAPSGGPPGGGPPGGAAPSGGPPGGGPPGGAPPGGGPPGGGPPGGAAPSGGPPGGSAPSGGLPSGVTPSAGLSEDAPKPSGAKSSLQSEMLQEMERLKALMGGD